jgi:hypothetical protein
VLARNRKKNSSVEESSETSNPEVEISVGKKGKQTRVSISPPNIKTARFRIIGTSPLMTGSFGSKAQNAMREKHEAGSTAGSKRTRKARDFQADYESAKYISEEGWIGAPAGAFRTAMIDCCRLVGYKMTNAKLSIFVEADGYQEQTLKPLVKIIGKPEMNVGPVRNATGVADLRARPLWRKWQVDLRINFDMDQFELQDVTNLLMRAGMQCGIGDGRPNSRESTGIGYGLWRVQGE